MNKLLITISFLFLSSFLIVNGQVNIPYNPEDETIAESCTSIMVAKGASSDGSVMTAHSCDANYRTWLTIEPRKVFLKGDMETIYEGLLHNEEPWDFRKVVKKGEIPAKPGETFRFLNVAYPCMNEKQLAIGETTTSGREELYNENGMFMIEELERLALQYCSDARSAISLMGSLAETYGYGDGGECLTVADKKEVWHFEIYGSGKGKPSAIWVAQRIPDDHVGVSANIPRIGKVDFNSPNYFMYSSDIKEKSKKLGLWDGKSPYVFYKVVSKGKPFSVREYYILNNLAPSLKLQYDAEELPFSVKPDVKVTPQKMMELYRATYEGTEFDSLKDLYAEVKQRQRLEDGTIKEYMDTIRPLSPFMNSDMRALVNTLKPDAAKRVRTVAVIQCAYSHIIQLRDWLPDEVGGVAYFSFDNPAQSPRIPIYCGTTSLPKSFSHCGQWSYRPEAAVWSFRETNRIATINWDKTRKVMEPAIMELENLMLDQNAVVEKKAAELIKEGKIEEGNKLLTAQTNNFAQLSMSKWKELKEKLWMFFVRSM